MKLEDYADLEASYRVVKFTECGAVSSTKVKEDHPLRNTWVAEVAWIGSHTHQHEFFYGNRWRWFAVLRAWWHVFVTGPIDRESFR